MIAMTVQVQPNAVHKWWGEQQEKSKIAYFVANNAVTKTLVKGITYDCHSVVTVRSSHFTYNITLVSHAACHPSGYRKITMVCFVIYIALWLLNKPQ